MKDDNEKALESFLDDENKEKEVTNKSKKVVVLDEREGLIERLNPIFVDSNGKQLLREVY